MNFPDKSRLIEIDLVGLGYLYIDNSFKNKCYTLKSRFIEIYLVGLGYLYTGKTFKNDVFLIKTDLSKFTPLRMSFIFIKVGLCFYISINPLILSFIPTITYISSEYCQTDQTPFLVYCRYTAETGQVIFDKYCHRNCDLFFFS